MTIQKNAYLTNAGISFGAFAILGAIVAHTLPNALDRSELGTYGVGVPLAQFFTSAGRFPTYVALCVVALIFGIVRRAWLSRTLVAVIGLIVVWQTSDLMKLAFHRARPPHPILAETSFAYPSGHADLAIYFYGFWAFCIWNGELEKPIRATVVSVLVLWIAAIGWSRLSLGAHYPSDIFGGYFYGAGFLSLAAFTMRARTASAPRS